MASARSSRHRSSSWIARRSWACASQAAATPPQSSAAPRTSWAFVNVTNARSSRPVLPYRLARFRNAHPRPWRCARSSFRWNRSRASSRKASARFGSSRFAAKTPAARSAWPRSPGSPDAFASCNASSRAVRASSHRRSSIREFPCRRRASARIAGSDEARASSAYRSAASAHRSARSFSTPSWSAAWNAWRSIAGPTTRPKPFALCVRVALVRPSDFLDRRDDALDLGRSDARVDGELEQTRDDVLRDGTSTADLQVPQGLLLVERHRIRWPAADPVLGQVLDDLVPGPWERLLPPDDVLVVRMDHPIAFGGRDETLDAVEAFGQRARVRPPLLHPAVELRELREADRGRDFRHPIVETHEDVLVLRRLAVMPEEPGPLRDAVVVGDDHAALAGRHVLRRVEGEARRVSEVARLLAVVLRAGGLGGVFDDGDAAVPSGGEDRVHLGGLAVQVGRHDRRGLARDDGGDLRGVHVVRRPIDVDEDRLRAAEQDRRRGREERQGRDHHLLARTDAVREQGDVEGRGAVRDGDRVLPVEVLGERLLECLDLRALGEHPGPEDLTHRREFLFAEDRAGDRDHRGAERETGL